MENIAADRDREARERIFVHLCRAAPQHPQDRAQIQQCLRGVLVHAVAGVQHRQRKRAL